MKHWYHYLAIVAVCLGLQACADSAENDFKLVQVAPNKGTKGTTVTLSGSGFVRGMNVCFAHTCAEATVMSPVSAVISAPEGTGTVEVCVKIDSSSSCLSNAFTYETASVVGECDYEGIKCSDDGFAVLTCHSKEETRTPCANGCEDGRCKSAPIGDVTLPSVSGISPVSGKAGTTLKVSGANLDQASKVCFGSTCVDPSSKASNALTVVVPEGTGVVAVTVQIEGKTLVAGSFSYLSESEEVNVVDWCQITYVNSEIEEGASVEAYAQVYKNGVTGTSGSHSGLEGEVGYLDAASADVGDITKYRWEKSVRNDQFSGEASGSNDEYMVRDLNLEKGTYRIAYRFSVNKGEFLYCDSDGTGNGFDVANTPTVTVREKGAAVAKKVEWCNIVAPMDAIESKVGVDSENVYVQAFVPDCTNYQEHCSELTAQIGFGLEAQAGTQDLANIFTWRNAEINAQYDGSGGLLHDEFMGVVNTDVAGVYRIVYRLSLDGGVNWTYCDATNDAQFSATDGVKWTVRSEDPVPEKKTVGWCVVHAPKSYTAVLESEDPMIYGRVYVEGCTGTETGCAGLVGELGVKKQGSEEDYAYTEAEFNSQARQNYDHKLGNNDEFMAKLALPTEAGAYDYVYRFKVDDGEWVMCDTDDALGFDAAKSGLLTVTEKPTQNVEWCRIVNSPASSEVVVGSESDAVYAQVYVPSCTNAKTHCANLKAEMGFGQEGVAYDKMTWAKAEINADYAPTTEDGQNNDEFMAKVKPSEKGSYDVYYRFSLDDGANWVYCDTAGIASETSLAPYKIEAKASDEARIEWCRLDTPNPTVIAGKTEDENAAKIYGSAFVKDCTGKADGKCASLTGYIGYGKPGDAVEDFTFVEAQYERNDGNNDKYEAVLKGSPEMGTYALVYAFSLDGGKTKTYCDTEDSSTFDAAKMGKLVSTGPYAKGDALNCGFSSETLQGVVGGMSGTPTDIPMQLYWQGHTENNGTSRPNEIQKVVMYYIESSKAESNPAEYDLSQWHVSEAMLSGTAGDSHQNQVYVVRQTFTTPGTYKYVFALEMPYQATDGTSMTQTFFCSADWRRDALVYGELEIK